MKILFCARHTNTIIDKDSQRCQTFRELGYDVHPFGCHSYETYTLCDRLGMRLGVSGLPRKNIVMFNQDFLKTLSSIKPDIVWVEKAELLLPETIEKAKEALPSTLWVHYLEDNPFGSRRNEIPIWKNFITTIPQYDIHFVKRQSDVENFLLHDAQRVVITRTTGFHPAFYRPYKLSDVPIHLRHEVVFIGTALDHRVGSISHLIFKERLGVDVYGNLWNRHPVYFFHRNYFHGHSGLNYPLIVSGSKICLGYVSSSNMDEYNGRSFEIPACGGFFLAERTPMHLELYREGEEAEFFSSNEECAEKIRFYLRNDNRRLNIARAGYERCLSNDYSLARSLRNAMQEISAVFKEGK